MALWIEWLAAVNELRSACSRTRTFLWLVLSLAALSCRSDNAGVTSFVRVLNFRPEAYHRFLHFFHCTGIDLELLTAAWARLCLVLFRPVEVDSRLICLADGIKAPKEGKKMPAVKSLHQQSASNTKPEYIMGHSFQAISLLVQTSGGHVASVPLASRIHEGVVFSNRDQKTLLDKLVALLRPIAKNLHRATSVISRRRSLKPSLRRGYPPSAAGRVFEVWRVVARLGRGVRTMVGLVHDQKNALQQCFHPSGQ